MPLDHVAQDRDAVTPLALPAYEQAYVSELFVRLQPGAASAYNEYIFARTKPAWMPDMQARVTGPAIVSVLPAYEQAYVAELYTTLAPLAQMEYTTYIIDRTPPAWVEQMTTALAASDADMVSWSSAVTANGGTVSYPRLRVISSFIAAEKAAGTWALTDDYWVLYAENTAQALTSLKQKRLAVAVGSPVFMANQGYAFDGATTYLTSGFIPSVHAVAMTGTNLRIAAHEMTEVTGNSNTFAAGVIINSTSQNLRLIPWRGSTLHIEAYLNSSVIFSPAAKIGGVGYNMASRNAAVWKTARNGVVEICAAPGTNGTALPTVEMFIGAMNGGTGVAASWRNARQGLICVGASLSDAQEAAQYSNVVTLAASVGANIGI